MKLQLNYIPKVVREGHSYVPGLHHPDAAPVVASVYPAGSLAVYFIKSGEGFYIGVKDPATVIEGESFSKAFQTWRHLGIWKPCTVILSISQQFWQDFTTIKLSLTS